MNNNKLRGIISTILILSALISCITGAVLYFLQYGMWLIFTRDFLNDVHAVSGLVMALAVIVHLIINYRIYTAEIRALFQRKQK